LVSAAPDRRAWARVSSSLPTIPRQGIARVRPPDFEGTSRRTSGAARFRTGPTPRAGAKFPTAPPSANFLRQSAVVPVGSSRPATAADESAIHDQYNTTNLRLGTIRYRIRVAWRWLFSVQPERTLTELALAREPWWTLVSEFSDGPGERPAKDFRIVAYDTPGRRLLRHVFPRRRTLLVPRLDSRGLHSQQKPADVENALVVRAWETGAGCSRPGLWASPGAGQPRVFRR